MAGLDGLTAQTLGSSKSFNWTWSIELLTSGILVLWFLFYLNRLFATVVSYGIRTYSWHKFRVYLDIKSLQISFLGGRIFFKGVRYHGENETVYIHNGHLTWRYWLRTTKQVDLCKTSTSTSTSTSTNAATEQGSKQDKSRSESGSDTEAHLPIQPRNEPESRLVVTITGLEWFIYNRTPLYDAIVQDSGVRASGSASVRGESTADGLARSFTTKLRKRTDTASITNDTQTSANEKAEEKHVFADSPSASSNSQDAPRADSDRHSISTDGPEAETEVDSFYSMILRFFPVAIDCSRGAISLGNEHTKAIIVTTFDKAKGHVDAGASGPADIFKQIFDFDIEHPVVQMKPNPDFHLPQMAAAERIITGHEAVLRRTPWWRPNLNLVRRRRMWTHKLRNSIPLFRRSVTSFHGSPSHNDHESTYTAFVDAQSAGQDWHGLDRYMDEDEGDDHQTWLGIEYARFSTLFDCPYVHFNFYWDTPGKVQPEHTNPLFSGLATDLNGIQAPAYGMHLDVYGGLVNYGPWSDRLRIELQNIFLPAGFKTTEPKAALAEGDFRLSTVMTITVNIKKEITLRVPSREGSKDWRWRGRATAVRDAAALRKQQQRRHFRFRRSTKRRLGPDVRPFGWIAVAAGAGSKVRYVMDMSPGIDGYRNTLQLSLMNTKATSSVNHAILWECTEQDVSADLSNPLGWNQLHTWRFDIMNKNMNLFLLRDHTFLLLDLISDFTAGQKSDYMTFMPFRYIIGIKFLDLNLYLNANDHNIIDNPCDTEENTFLILGFSRLVGEVNIPMANFSPAQSTVSFKGDGQDASLTLKTPVWHTLHTFGSDDNMAALKTLHLEGSYNYFSATSPTLTDSLFMTIIGGYPKFNLQGYLIRYFMNVKENYFGETIHFTTLEEHQARLESLQRGEEERMPPLKKENDLDVILSVRAENAAALMPASIYSREENLRVDVLLVEADMRFTNYYMDLQVNTSPIEVSVEKDVRKGIKSGKVASSCQVYIDGVSVYGHRLFGAPPTEPTYLCNWDFDVGNISGESTTEFIRIMLSAILSFIFTMDDDENALPKVEIAIIPDITFLRMRAAGIHLWVISADTAFLVEVAATTVELNDWANKHFSKYVKVNVPLILVAAVDGKMAYRYSKTLEKSVPTYACIRTSARLAVLDRKSDFAHSRALQQKHIRFHDSRTRRAVWLLHRQPSSALDTHLSSWSRQPPAMPVPLMPEPVNSPEIDDGRNDQVSTRESSSFLVPNLVGQHRPSQSSGSVIALPRLHNADANSSSMKKTLISSPWTKPQYQLRDIRPDLHHMPQLHLDSYEDVGQDDDDFDEEDFATLTEDLQHDGIFCNLIEGLSGFCTPNIAQSIVSLLNEVSPRRPEAILDDLQMQVVSNIKKLTNQHISVINDLSFRLPAAQIRIISHHEFENTGAGGTGFDQYDFKVRRARAILRIAPAAHTKTLENHVLVHASSQALKIEVAEAHPQVNQLMMGGEISLSDVGLWLSLRDEVRARIKVGGLDFTTAGENINQLAGLIQRSEQVVFRVIEEVKQFDLPERTQHLLYHLTSVQNHVDPPFMSRPVNVLRTADEHIRLHDSWKMITRLRNVFIAERSRQKSFEQCSGDCLHEDAQQSQRRIMSSFNQWKTWESTGQDNNALVQAVFGPARRNSTHTQPSVNTEMEVLLGRAAITIDPGPAQSQCYVQSLDLNFAEKESFVQGAAGFSGRPRQRSKVLQTYCGAIGCQLHWELINLTERVVELTDVYAMRQPTKHSESSVRKSPNEHPGNDILVVIGADVASIELRSPNIHVITGVERFKASMSIGADAPQRTAMSLMLSASSGRLRINGGGRSVLGCKVIVPTIYANVHNDAMRSDNVLVLHAAATCEKLRLNVKGDFLGILQLVQSILENEVVAVNRLVAVLATKSNTKRANLQTAEPKQSTRTVEPHVAFFLDDYLMQLDLMRYLRYTISGKTARTSVVPHGHKHFSVQLDIKDNTHSFENPSMRTTQRKPILTMPPISTAITIALLPDRLSVNTRAIVELMLLDASAIRACFDAAYQPQTITYVKDAQKSITAIQQKVQSMFPQKRPQDQVASTKTGQRQVEYHGYVVLEGVRVHCNAPALRVDQDYTVDLDVQLESTSLQISNSLPASKILAQKPHFEFNMQRIAVRIARNGKTNENFGHAWTGLRVASFTESDEAGDEIQNFHIVSNSTTVDLYAETVVLAVDLITFLQARIKSLAAAEDAKKLRPLRRLTLAAPDTRPFNSEEERTNEEEFSTGLLKSTFALELNAICIRWLVSQSTPGTPGRTPESMTFTVRKIDLRTKREASARLTIRGLQLQLVPSNHDPFERAANSALLPEMIFNAAYGRSPANRKFAFKAAGKILDVRLASNFIVPASAIQKSLGWASAELRSLKLSTTKADSGSTQAQLPKLLGTKRLAQLLVFADFAGAQITVSPTREENQEQGSAFGFLKGAKRSKAGRYGQAVQSSTGVDATLRAPGIAFQVEYADDGDSDPTLSTEIRVAASSNTLAPSVVPLMLEISSSVTNLMEQNNSKSTGTNSTDTAENTRDKVNESVQQATDPTAILGRVKLNAGLMVQKQEFSLTCQPIARVSATARFDEIFVIVNTVQAKEQERFFSIMTSFNNLAASVQHVYSRESTASFAVESIMISLMNSKHFSGQSGISAILNISPMKAYLNAKQMQDFLLFREIWYPAELRASPRPEGNSSKNDMPQGPALQRFQEATATGALPWHAVVSIQAVKLQVDFGQSIGKSDFAIEQLWASSKKGSDSEQNLCIGFDKIGMESIGRMSGFIELQGFRVRTAIRWPMVRNAIQAPLVQGSVGFEHLRAKAVFDYQPFLVADISTFDFLIYNVRQGKSSDRLVGILDGGKVQAFCTTAAAAQVLAIHQAFERLVQEKQEAFESSLHELDKYLRRKSVMPLGTWKPPTENEQQPKKKAQRPGHAPSLHVDVVITLTAIDAGVFMTSLFDETSLKLEAVEVQARFAVGETENKTHSGLGMRLGQVHLALSALARPNAQALGEVSVVEVIDRATAAKGGTILKVPRLMASMQTWQQASSNVIEYIFSSTFQGKVDIGWNYSRISTIRRMWDSHSRALTQKLNKPLAPSAIQITAEPRNEAERGSQDKITAVVHMPQSKYEYIALQPPIIDTPQLRDLGEATPSLEWIGLHRERLPHVTHSIIIVSLLEVAKEIEDTYSRILGSGSDR